MLEVAWVTDVVRAARRLGLETGDLSTNGTWWRDRRELEADLHLLCEAGFEAGFHLSVDAFHSGSGSDKQAAFVLTALAEFGRVGNLSCAETPEHPASPAIARLAKQLGGRVVAESATSGQLVFDGGEMSYHRFPVADVGQHRRVGVSTGAEWFGRFDCFGHDSVYLDPTGKAHFCLGFASYVAPALCLGDVTTRGLKEVLAAAQVNPLILLLCAEGPQGLRRVIEASEPDAFAVPWASPCAFCYHCLTDDRPLRLLQEAAIVA